MMSGDSVDWMVDSADDLTEVCQNFPNQAARPAPLDETVNLAATGEIVLRQDFVAVSYVSKLGPQTLTQ